jgi:hypothetical protein
MREQRAEIDAHHIVLRRNVGYGTIQPYQGEQSTSALPR